MRKQVMNQAKEEQNRALLNAQINTMQELKPA